MRISKIAFLIAATLAVATSPAAANYGDISQQFPYSKNSQFVRFPGHVVGAVLSVPGYLLASILVCPFVALKSKEPVTARSYFGECSAGGGVLGFYGGTAVGGAPFYALEEIFWDLPHTALENSGKLDHPRTGSVINGKPVWDERPIPK